MALDTHNALGYIWNFRFLTNWLDVTLNNTVETELTKTNSVKQNKNKKQTQKNNPPNPKKTAPPPPPQKKKKKSGGEATTTAEEQETQWLKH